MINGLHKVIFLLGSNLGDKEGQLSKARKLISRDLGEIKKSSGIYETEPWGKEDQPWYLNQAISVMTSLDLNDLFSKLQSMEKELGRNRSEEIKWGPRPIDIDVLFFDEKVIQEEKIMIPHPHIPDRNFVLVPLSEIEGDFEHPIIKKTIKEIAGNCTDNLKVNPYSSTKIKESP